MAEIDRFRIVDALFIIGSIITFIADQATGESLLETSGKYSNVTRKIFKYLHAPVTWRTGSGQIIGNSFDINQGGRVGA